MAYIQCVYRGLDIEFYKAFFGKIFLDNVKEGYDCAEKTNIYKLASPLNIMEELRKILRIFYALKEELKKENEYLFEIDIKKNFFLILKQYENKHLLQIHQIDCSKARFRI